VVMKKLVLVLMCAVRVIQMHILVSQIIATCLRMARNAGLTQAVYMGIVLLMVQGG